MNTGKSHKIEAIREFASASLTNAFQDFGDPLAHDLFEVFIFNDTSANIYLSIDDGVTTQIIVPSGMGRSFDESTNDLYWLKGAQVQIKYETAPAAGKKVYLEAHYG